MGEIADGLINGDFDFYTGEYIGRGYGIPRTKNKYLKWEKKNNQHNKKNFLTSKEVAYDGVKVYIIKKWNSHANMPSVRSLVYEYFGETGIDLKQKCLEIQKDWLKFCQWVNKNKLNT